MSRIVVVEDEAIVARSISATLRENGHDVAACASTGDEAIKAVDAHQPDLVLMDIHLRGPMDGIEAARRIREKVDTPIVFLTAYGDREHLERAKDSAPHGYLLKPYTDRELLTTIEVAVNRYQRERALGDRARWLAVTLRSLGDGVIAVDRNQRVTFLNQAAERITGWGNEDAKDRSISEILCLVDGKGIPLPAPPIGRAISECLVLSVEQPAFLQTRAGSLTPIDDSVAPIIEADGSVVGGVIVFRDVTERRVLEARLALAERMAGMVTVTAGVGHELNNPLMANLVNLELAHAQIAELAKILGSETDSEAMRRSMQSTLTSTTELLADAQDGAFRMRDIIGSLRELGRTEASPRETFPIVRVVETALRLVANELEQRATIERDIRARPMVTGHEGRLLQVFSNILVNAAQAMPERGKPGMIRVVVDETADAAIVDVVDSGCGITPEIMVRIFEPFFTTRGIGQGSGLGLAIARSIATNHGGEITASSQPGAGSTFRIRLPRATPPVASAPPVASGAQFRNLLLIDDDAFVGRALKRMLESDYQVRFVTSAREALDAIAENPPDLVVSDLMMPEMNGIELYEVIEARYPTLAPRVLFITGGAFTPQSEAFVTRHAARVVYKPIMPDALLEALAAIE